MKKLLSLLVTLVLAVVILPAATTKVSADFEETDAYIGVYTDAEDEMFTGENSYYAQGDYRYFHTDSEEYCICAVYDASNPTNAHQFYINSLDNDDIRNPRIKGIKVNNSALIESAVFDYDTQTTPAEYRKSVVI